MLTSRLTSMFTFAFVFMLLATLTSWGIENWEGVKLSGPLAIGFLLMAWANHRLVSE